MFLIVSVETSLKTLKNQCFLKVHVFRFVYQDHYASFFFLYERIPTKSGTYALARILFSTAFSFDKQAFPDTILL